MSPSPRGILLDIEGTTTSIAFVHDVLFPHARARLDAACARASSDPRLAEAVATLREEHEKEPGAELPAFGSGAPYARHLMESDRKSTGLKLLQGLIWEEGYRTGALRGHVFVDVPEALARWRRSGVRLRVFSSGSVLAQKLLFGHTEHGDLTVHFEGFHDTTTGAKRDAGAYAKIAGAFGLPPAEIAFLSDTVAELDAAAAAGMRTALMIRPGNAPADPGPHPSHRTFAELP